MGQIRFIVRVIACSVLVAALSTSAFGAAHAGPSGGTIIMDVHDDIAHLDPGKCYDIYCVSLVRTMYDQLVQYDAGHGAGTNLIPDAAASMPVVTDAGRTYTFRLRRDVRFWNGRQVTSADWIYSFERVIDPKTQAGAASFWMNIVGAAAFAAGKAPHVAGLQALGQFDLRIQLIAPDASFLNVLAMTFGSVVDRNQIARYGKSFDALHPMGTGPYIFQERQLGQHLILRRNPQYFGTGAGHADAIDVEVGVAAETAYLRVMRGQADILGDGIPAADLQQTLSDPVWKHQVTRQINPATQFMYLNTLVKPFNNLLVRQAVNMAINKPFLVRILAGAGSVTNNFLPPTMPGYHPFNLYPYNPAKARTLLAQAGYAHGFSTTLYVDNVAEDPRLAQAIAPMLAAIGITAQIQVVNYNTLVNLGGTKGKTPMAMGYWYQDFPDPNDFFEPILSCATAIPGTYNWSWYCDPAVDAFAHKLKVMTDRTSRLRLYPALDQMMMHDAPIVPLLNPIYYDIHSRALHHYYLQDVWNWIYADYTKS